MRSILAASFLFLCLSTYGCGSDSAATAGGTGGAAGAATGSSSCGGTAVDVSTDAHNCGRCGHDCLGTDCKAGICVPVAIATGVSVGIYSPMVLQGGFLYWEESGGAKVERIRADGSGRKVVLKSSDGIAGYAVGDGGIYWASAGTSDTTPANSVSFSPDDGGPAHTLATGLFSPSGLALQGEKLFVGDSFPSGVGSGQIASLPKAGGSLTPLFQARVADILPGGGGALVVRLPKNSSASDGPFFGAGEGPLIVNSAGAIEHQFPDGDQLRGLAANDEYAVWGSGTSVLGYAFATKQKFKLPTTSLVLGVALVGGEVIAGTQIGIERFVLPGESSELLFTVPTNQTVDAMAADATYVFWFTRDTDSLMRWTR